VFLDKNSFTIDTGIYRSRENVRQFTLGKNGRVRLEQKLLMFQDKRSLLSRNIFRSSEACLETGGRHFETLLWKYFRLNLRGMTLQRQLPCWRERPVRCCSWDVGNTHAEKSARWEHRVRGRTVFRRTEGTQVCLSSDCIDNLLWRNRGLAGVVDSLAVVTCKGLASQIVMLCVCVASQ
jgi:hypothetical protein